MKMSSPRSSLTLAAIDLSGLFDRTHPNSLQMQTSVFQHFIPITYTHFLQTKTYQLPLQ